VPKFMRFSYNEAHVRCMRIMEIEPAVLKLSRPKLPADLW